MHRVYEAIVKNLTHVDNISYNNNYYVVLLMIMSYPKCNYQCVNSNLVHELNDIPFILH